MKIEPKAGPAINLPPTATGAQQTGVQRAIAKFNAGLVQQAESQTPIPVNANAISPEDLSAIKSSTSQGQVDTIEASEPAQEAPVEETPKAKEEPLSSQYAVIARKEKAIRARELALRAREDAIRAKEQPAAPVAASLDESKYISKDKLAENPLQVLSDLGLSFDKITELALNAPKPEEVAQQQILRKLEAEIKALKDGQENAQKNFNDTQKRNYEQAVTQIRNETKNLVSTDPNFETIKETGSAEDVVDLIKQTFDKEGILLTVEEAAKEVEDYLVEEAIKISKIRKIQQRLAAKPAVTKQQEPVQAKQQHQPKTLTNNIGGSSQLSARERAILAFKGQLKG